MEIKASPQEIADLVLRIQSRPEAAEDNATIFIEMLVRNPSLSLEQMEPRRGLEGLQSR